MEDSLIFGGVPRARSGRMIFVWGGGEFPGALLPHPNLNTRWIEQPFFPNSRVKKSKVDKIKKRKI